MRLRRFAFAALPALLALVGHGQLSSAARRLDHSHPADENQNTNAPHDAEHVESETKKESAKADVLKTRRTINNDASITISLEESCSDENEKCKFWTELGECDTNPVFMRGTCRQSCGACHDKPTGDKNNDKCKLYLAESTSPNGGLGLYSAIPLNPGDEIPSAVADIVIQLHDVEYNDALRREKHYISPNSTDASLLDTLSSFVWEPASQTGGEFDALDVKSMSSGLGMLAKRKVHQALANVLLGRPDIDNGRLHRSQRAGSGAISAYHNRRGKVLKEIQAGAELFVAYGENAGIQDQDSPLMDVLDAIFQLSRNVDSSDFDSKVYELTVEHLQRANDGVYDALPKSFDDAKEIRDFMSMSPEDAAATSLRSVSWLEKNGMCVDNMHEGLSGNLEAGRGAFATRPIAKGRVIAPVPVIPIRRKTLEVYYQDATETIDLMGYQLLRNYCFGNKHSSLLLFPYSPVVNLINHDKEPNAFIRWSTHSFHSNESLEKSVDDLLQESQPRLMMEIVASGSINAGDEIRIDYGSEWKDAWDDHVQNWQSDFEGATNGTATHLSASALNSDASSDVLTLDDEEAYPSNLAVDCYVDSTLEYTEDGEKFAWREPPDAHHRISFDCDIVSKKDNTYKVKVYVDDEKSLIFNNVPRHAISFVDVNYSKDQYIKGSFRHEIGLPEGMFPEQWIDLDKGDESAGDSCQLFVAESSIPNSGLGMYTLKDIKENDAIFYPEIIIQQQDHDWHNRERYYWFKNRGKLGPTTASKDEKHWLLHMYYWEPRNTLGMYDGEEETQSITPGLGMLANSHTGLVNALMTRPEVNTAGLHRSADPGAGAFSAYHKYTYLATQDIPAGMELFVEYGDDWFEERQDTLGVIPLSSDFSETDKILKHFFQFIDEIPKEPELQGSAWGLVYDFLVENKKMETVLPKDMLEAREKAKGGTAKASVPNAIRSAEWLEENGRCLDNIKEDVSTVKQAGRGAFATREIKKSTVIAPMPLVHIERKHLHSFVYNWDTEEPDYIGEQVLLNYCYGHRNSSLLFFPYAPVVNFINHDHSYPNAYIRWSDLSSHQSDWLEYTAEEVTRQFTAGLVLEVVALRDIDAGEEIFINYGDDWQEAWDAHVREWKPPPGADAYISASELNERGGPILTMQEQERTPYPENLLLTCYSRHNLKERRSNPRQGPLGEEYEWRNQKKLLYYHDNAYPCEILVRHEDFDDLSGSIRPESVTYTARIYFDDVEDEDESNEGTIVYNIPPRAIEFVDLHDTKDQFLRNAFRHAISLPDDVFPKQWQDLPDGVQTYEKAITPVVVHDEL